MFESSHPSGTFEYTAESCDWPSIEKPTNGVLFPDKERRDVALCFRPEPTIKQPYDAFVYLESIAENDDLENGYKKGDPLISFGDRDNRNVESYISERTQNPGITQNELLYVERNLWKQKPKAIWERLKESIPFFAGGIIFLWLFSAVLGWIIRGFTGIPSGQDFRPID